MLEEANTELNTENIIANVESAEDLSEEQKTHLEEHKDELTQADADKFGITLEKPTPVTRNSDFVDEEDKGKGKKEDEDEELAPEDKDAISKQVNKTLDPIIKRNRETQDRVEVDTFIGANPLYAPYKATIMEHLKNPSYANIPVDRIATMIAGPDLMKIGARKEREAQAKAKETQSPGNSARPSGTAPKNWGTASQEDFAKKRAEVLGHA